MAPRDERSELALRILAMLEAKYPGLVDPWDPATESAVYDGGALQTDIGALSDHRSRLLYLRGFYDKDGETAKG